MINKSLGSSESWYVKDYIFHGLPFDRQIRSGWMEGWWKKREERTKYSASRNSSALWRKSLGPVPRTGERDMKRSAARYSRVTVETFVRSMRLHLRDGEFFSLLNILY